MEPADVAHVIKTQAKTIYLFCLIIVHPVKFFRNVFQFFLSNADSIINEFNHQGGSFFPGVDCDHWFASTIFGSIIQQVINEISKMKWIS